MRKFLFIVLSAVGVMLAALGLLWFLQGSNVIQIDPILCTGNCEPIEGYSLQWQLTGAVTLLLGASLGIIAIRKLRT
jgi:hypothetical protein